MNFPTNVKYAKSHEWLRTEDNTGYIGITDYAQSELGDVVFVDITVAVGDTLSAGDSFGTIEAVKTVSDVYLPVAGTVVEINGAISDSPDLLNNDPFGDGWMIKIELAADADASGMMDAGVYQETVGH